MTTRAEIVAIARGFLGVRFAHQGRNRADGLDCLGLLLATAHAADLTLNGQSTTALDKRDYGARPDTELLREQLEALLVSLPLSKFAAANILLLHIEGRPQHLAMITDYPQPGEWGMIHAYAMARKVVEHRLDQFWRDAIAGVYRLPMFTD